MNKIKLGVGLLSLAAACAWGQSTMVSSFTNNALISIPDGNPVGVTEHFAVSGLSGDYISNVQVHLDIAGGFNGDLYIYLVSPQNQLSVLLNRVGLSAGNPAGYGDAGFNIILGGQSTTNIHTYQGGAFNISGGQLTGLWAADGRMIDPQSPGTLFDSTLPTATLGIYNGLIPATENGIWTLFIADMAGGGSAPVISQAVLTVVTAPEPSTLALAVAGVAAAFLVRRRRNV